MVSVPDLSDLRALIADDRADVRDLLAATLRQLGVNHIDTVPSGVPGPLLSITTTSSMAGAPVPHTAEQLSEVVSRFTHDVMNPLQSALVFSRFLAAQPGGETAADDLKVVHAAVEEVAGLVGQLIERLVAASRASQRSNDA
jgi:CheY-like chemotaxis protein